jgi:hypothetical protein
VTTLSSKDKNRLIPLPIIDHTAHFKIEKTSKIFTIGSCFARNIERYLMGSGFEVLSNEFSQYIDGDASIQNKYNSASIRQDLEIALSKPSLMENIINSFFEKENSYHSLHFGGSGQIKIRTYEELKSLTKQYYETIKKIVFCDLVIITLGLVEVWYDKQAKCFLNIAPPKTLVAQYPKRYELCVQSYFDILNDLEIIYKLLEKYLPASSKILITVSPVPLQATFRKQDVLQANMYSKSVQRSVIDEFLVGKNRVNYFPSYEIVNLADHHYAWISSDYRHVHADMVAHIMSNFLNKYVSDMSIIPTKISLIDDYKKRKYLKIYTDISNLLSQNEKYWEIPRLQFLYVNYYYGLSCIFLIKEKNDIYYQQAVKNLNTVFNVNKKHYSSALKLADLYIKYNENEKALIVLDQVLKVEGKCDEAQNLKSKITGKL